MGGQVACNTETTGMSQLAKSSVQLKTVRRMQKPKF
jgi:hypothetical protein